MQKTWSKLDSEIGPLYKRITTLVNNADPTLTDQIKSTKTM